MPSVLIISPATAKSNNGNWQTAQRWQSMLASHAQCRIEQDWNADQAGADLMIALHARKSASAIANWAAAFPSRPLILVLTGTDLYRDIHHDPAAQRSLQLATQLIVLQDAAHDELPPALQAKTRVIYQSAPRSSARAASKESRFTVLMAGHLRDEKMPQTFMQAGRLDALRGKQAALWLQAGDALTPELEQAAQHCERELPNYRWLRGLPHAQMRVQIAQADALILPSAMEGGANVIIEAVVDGVPVLASDISGNRGMLGTDYDGLFPLGDAQALASMVMRLQTDAAWRALLKQQCAARAPLFDPQREQAALLQVLDNALFPERDRP